jgi:TIR domain
MDFDIFISYSSLNRKFMQRQLKYPLELKGFTVAIDYSDFDFGEWTEQNIYLAIERSSWILLALTPAWARSEWCEFEAKNSLLTKRGRIIPIILETCETPNYLSSLTWCDLTESRYYDANFNRLVNRLRSFS